MCLPIGVYLLQKLYKTTRSSADLMTMKTYLLLIFSFLFLTKALTNVVMCSEPSDSSEAERGKGETPFVLWTTSNSFTPGHPITITLSSLKQIKRFIIWAEGPQGKRVGHFLPSNSRMQLLSECPGNPNATLASSATSGWGTQVEFRFKPPHNVDSLRFKGIAFASPKTWYPIREFHLNRQGTASPCATMRCAPGYTCEVNKQNIPVCHTRNCRGRPGQSDYLCQESNYVGDARLVSQLQPAAVLESLGISQNPDYPSGGFNPGYPPPGRVNPGYPSGRFNPGYPPPGGFSGGNQGFNEPQTMGINPPQNFAPEYQNVPQNPSFSGPPPFGAPGSTFNYLGGNQIAGETKPASSVDSMLDSAFVKKNAGMDAVDTARKAAPQFAPPGGPSPYSLPIGSNPIFGSQRGPIGGNYPIIGSGRFNSPIGGNGFGSPMDNSMGGSGFEPPMGNSMGSPFGGNNMGSPMGNSGFGSPIGGNNFGSPMGNSGFGSPIGGNSGFGSPMGNSMGSPFGGNNMGSPMGNSGFGSPMGSLGNTNGFGGRAPFGRSLSVPMSGPSAFTGTYGIPGTNEAFGGMSGSVPGIPGDYGFSSMPQGGSGSSPFESQY